MKTGRRGFLKGVFGVTLAPLLALLPKRKPEEKAIEVPGIRFKATESWTKEELIAKIRECHKNTKWQPPLKKVHTNTSLFEGQAVQWDDKHSVSGCPSNYWLWNEYTLDHTHG